MTTATPSASHGTFALICLVFLSPGCNSKGLIGIPQQAQRVPAPVTAEPQDPDSSLSPQTPATQTPARTTSPSADLTTTTSPALPAPGPQSNSPPAPPTGTLYSDSFADVGGSIKRHETGKQLFQGPRNTRQIYFFAGQPEDGNLTLQIVEDATTPGPDDQPGVLALSWQQLPRAIAYSGFAYLGGATAERRMALAPLQQITALNDLAGMRLKFRYKGLKADPAAPVKIHIGCRLEPTLPESYARRLDMGRFIATAEWGTYDAPLTEGSNGENFLRAITEEKPTAFKVIFAQATPTIKDYQPGDTLLLDDIEIYQATAE